MLEIVKSKIAEVPVWQVASWTKLGISHGFLERDLDFRFPEKAWPLISKKQVKLCLLQQVHGIEVIDFDAVDETSLKNADSQNADGWIGSLSILEKKKIAVGIKTADCTPVLVFGKKRGTIMALHCGWRSAYDGLLGVGIKQMLSKGEAIDSIEVAFGPAAQIGCYEVGIDLANKFENKLRTLINASEEPLITRQSSGKFYLSISSYLEMEAISFGISKENIVVSEECTILEKNFFSFRREKDDSGRQLSFFSA